MKISSSSSDNISCLKKILQPNILRFLRCPAWRRFFSLISRIYLLSDTGVDPLVQGVLKSPATSTGPGYLPLTELILRSRISLEPKKRLAAVQWARALFLWSPVVLETMALLAGECTNHVLFLRPTSLMPLYLLLFCHLVLFPFWLLTR